MRYDIAIIGGGAAGMTAAIAAKRKNADGAVVVLEKNPRVLRKLLATGNGRCNFTNTSISLSRYYGEDARFAAPLLASFGTAEAVSFWEGLGVPSVVLEKGKLFPMSLQAASAADALRFEAERLGVVTMTDFAVCDVRDKAEFTCTATDGRTVTAPRLIITTGGRAAPELGADGSGYDILQRLGHSLTRITPALCQLKTEKSIVYGLQGIKLDASVTMLHQSKPVGTARDELLFTEQGLSGSVIFELSVLWHRFAPLTAQVDFLPDIGLPDLAALLRARRDALGHLSMEHYTNGLLHKKLGQALTKLSGIEKLSLPVSALTDSQIDAFARICKGFTVPVTGPTGFKNAQITAGGIRTGDFDADTMESRLVPRLFAAGEVLDIYGDCGGFNLHWAWASGLAAGRSAAQ